MVLKLPGVSRLRFVVLIILITSVRIMNLRLNTNGGESVSSLIQVISRGHERADAGVILCSTRKTSRKGTGVGEQLNTIQAVKPVKCQKASEGTRK